MSDGWDESAAAWIAEMAERGDYSREFVLDAPMLERVRTERPRAFRTALDVGCGEGRFCRMLGKLGIRATGIDPTDALLRRARQLDPSGDYRTGTAEALAFPAASFDLVVCYLSLIDVPDLEGAVGEMARVLRPSGSLLIANINAFATAAVDGGWSRDSGGERSFRIDRYLEERAAWASWRGIRIRNWHRPLSRYLSLLIARGLILRYFSEPEPNGGDGVKADAYRRAPLFHVMEWEKPPTPEGA